MEKVWTYLSQVAINLVCTGIMFAVPFSCAVYVGNRMGYVLGCTTCVIVYLFQLGIIIKVVK